MPLSPVFEFPKPLLSWKKTQGSSIKSWKTRRPKENFNSLSRSVILCARTIRMTCFLPLSWWGSFLERRWHYCWTAFSVYLPLYYNLGGGGGEKKIKTTRQKMLANPVTVNALPWNLFQQRVILRLCCSPLWRYLKPCWWQCWEK